MDYYIISFSITSLISFIIALFVLNRNTDKKLNCTFSIFAWCVSFWSFYYVLFCFSSSSSQALLWNRMLMAAAILIPTTFMQFILVLLELDNKYKPFIYANYVLSLGFLLALPSPLFTAKIIPLYNFTYWPDPGIVFHIYFIWFSLNILVAHLLMLNGLCRFKGAKKTQILYILAGTLIGFLGGSTNFFMWYKIPIPPAGSPLVALYVVTIAYAILKHHLMDITVVINRTMAYILTIVSLGAVYLLLAYGFRNFFSTNIDAGFLVMTVIYGIFVGEFHQKIRFFIQTTAEKKFLKSRYNYRRVLSRMSKKLSGCKTMGDIVKVINTDFINEIEARSVRIYLVNEK